MNGACGCLLYDFRLIARRLPRRFERLSVVLRKKYNKFGKLSTSPKGYGVLSAKGYLRLWDKSQKRYRFEHVLVWGGVNGEIPNGYQVHHVDGNKLNNDISNLEIKTALSHKREHGGCEFIDGEWYKPCRKCGERQHVDNFYKRKDGIASQCKRCSITAAVENKRRIKSRLRV